MTRPLSARKRDIVYLAFFCIHVPVMLVADLAPLYPVAIKPAFTDSLAAWYIKTYKDMFFVSPPAWFKSYLWMEALFHVPLSVWAVGALRRDDPKTPLYLLIYAVQTGVTTLTCLADMMSWTAVTDAEKVQLCGLYVPYLALAVFMGVDMFGRLNGMLDRGLAAAKGKKAN